MSSKKITVTIMVREFIVACPEGQEKMMKQLPEENR